MVFSLKGKTAIITGGGSGIGKAISTTFAKQGAHVCILDFNEWKKYLVRLLKSIPLIF